MSAFKLDVAAVATALAVTWAAAVLFLGLAAWTLGWGHALVDALGSRYLGYGPSLAGSLAGAPWALADGAVLGAVYAFIYNLVAARRQPRLDPSLRGPA